MKPTTQLKIPPQLPLEPAAQSHAATELRNRAEKALQTQAQSASAPQSLRDAQKLVHELQVHQIELEMQNEDLRKSHAEAEAGLARYTNLYDFAPSGCFTLQPDGEIVQANLAGARQLGAERAALKGTRFGAFVSQADLPVLNAFLQQVFASEIVQTCEVELVCAGQPQRIVQIEATLAQDWRDCRMVAVDITERVLAARKERQQRDYFENILNAVGVPIFVKDAQSRMVLLNDAFCALFDLSRSEVLGTTMVEHLPAQEMESFLRVDREVIRDGRKDSREESLTVTDGHTSTMLTTKLRFIDSLGDRFVIAVMQDISERKGADRTHRIVQATSVGLWEWNLLTDEVYFSPEWKQQLGYADDEIANRFDEWQKRVHPEDTARAQAAAGDFRDGRQPRYAVEVRMLHRDGSWRWIYGEADLERNENGEPVTMMGSHIDITDQKRIEEAVRESAENATLAKAEFLANMSHELRTPLNSIVGFSQLLANSKALDPGLRRYVDVISFSSMGLLSVVNDVLDFSSLEAGGLKLHAQPFSLSQLATHVVASMQIAADDKGLALNLALDQTIAARHLGDEGRLRQVLLNLLSNAVKFTESGSVTLSLKASDSGSAQQTLTLAVTDTGMGIPEDRLASVFTRFEQLDGSINRRSGGSGLGLAIVKYLVELMGGAVSVESVEGQGSQFQVTLCLSKYSGLETPPEAVSALTRQLDQRQMRMLVVDDEELNRELVRAQLAEYGYQIDVAGNGAEALQLVQEVDYDLVLMDVRMPVLDGLSATRAIRQIPRLLNLPIIALTAQAMPEQIQACSEAGMNDYLSKPMATDALRDSVRKWIGTNVPAASSESDVFQRLSDRFLVRCNAELQFIRDRQAVSAEELHDSIHRLAGSARMFGLAELSDAAIDIDRKLSSDETPAQIEYEHLINALQFVVENPSSVVGQLF